MVLSSQVPGLAPGARVLVRCSFDGHWASGFVVSAVLDTGGTVAMRVTRLSDGSELPHVFGVADVLPDPQAAGALAGPVLRASG
jgi:hypothetical protein